MFTQLSMDSAGLASVSNEPGPGATNELANEDLELVTAGAAKSLWGGGGYQLGQRVGGRGSPGYVPYYPPRGIPFPKFW